MINKLSRILGGGGHKAFKNQYGKEELRQGNILVSNSDFNRKRGELYLKSSIEDRRFTDGSNTSVISQSSDAIISNNIASENYIGGGQLRSTSNYGCELVSRPNEVNAGCGSLYEITFRKEGMAI